VFWVTQHAVPVEGADRRQPRVAGPGNAPSVGLQVVEERANQRRIEMTEIKL
jgi:hypothetical protein